MKNKLLTICLLLFTSQVFASDFEYLREVDEFDGTIKQILHKSQHYPGKNPRLAIQLFQSDNEVNEITTSFGILKYEEDKPLYYLFIQTKSADWNILNAKSAKVLLDGKRWNKHEINIPIGRINTDISEVVVHEGHAFYYSKKDFKKLSQGKIFKAKVGSLIYSIDLSKVDFIKLLF